LRGQAEAFAYGLPSSMQSDFDLLFLRMEQRFGILNMKESYIADESSKMRHTEKLANLLRIFLEKLIQIA
jgi:hypothetical protein